MNEPAFTIARAAEAAAVGVETIRYYERRGLVPQPAQIGTYRRYSRKHIARVRFIKRAQQLGFSLEEIEGLLALEDGDRRSEVQAIASARLAEIRSRIDDLTRMAAALAELLEHCRRGGSARCPIIAALATEEPAKTQAEPGKRIAAAAGARRRSRGARSGAAARRANGSVVRE